MRRLKGILRGLADDKLIRSATDVGRAAGIPKTPWLEYLNGARGLPAGHARPLAEHLRDELHITTAWAQLEEIVPDDERTAKAKHLGIQFRNGHCEQGPAGPDKPERRHLMLPRGTLEYFGLRRDPFAHAVGDVAGVFMSGMHARAHDAMKDAARYQYFAALIAEVGFGKTIIRKFIVDDLRKDGNYAVCTVEQLDRENLTIVRILDALLRDFAGKGSSTITREAKTNEVKRMLTTMHGQGKRAVLMIDEAHALHPSTLRGLKRLYEIEDGFTKLLSILLFGQPQMYSRLGGYDLEEVSQRLDIVLAHGLDTSLKQGPGGLEVEKPGRRKSCVPDYLAFKLTRAGARSPEKIIDAAAQKLIGKITDVPLRIHTLCCRAMCLAQELEYRTVSVDVIEALNVKPADDQ